MGIDLNTKAVGLDMISSSLDIRSSLNISCSLDISSCLNVGFSFHNGSIAIMSSTPSVSKRLVL